MGTVKTWLSAETASIFPLPFSLNPFQCQGGVGCFSEQRDTTWALNLRPRWQWLWERATTWTEVCTLLEFQSCCDTRNVNFVIFAIYFHVSFSPHGILKAPFTLLVFVSFSFAELEMKARSQLWVVGFGFTSKQYLFEPGPVKGRRSPHPSSPRLLVYVGLRWLYLDPSLQK